MQNIINGYYDDLQDQIDLYMQAGRGALMHRNRVNPYEIYVCDRQFKARYRFNKVSCAQLTNLVQPFFDINRNNHGLPCNPQQIVCSGLELMAGGHFFRVNGYASGISTTTAWRNLYRFVNALLQPQVRERFLHLPTARERAINMRTVYNKYGLHNVIAGVDGCHIPFLDRPRNLPEGRSHISFINRKGIYSLNAQIVAGIDRDIYFLVII